MVRQYRYNHLAPNEVRLLRLMPGSWSEVVHCELHHDDVYDSYFLVYEAVSYTWGAASGFQNILVENGNFALPLSAGPAHLKVTQSCYDALRRLRYRRRPRMLWVDAICINQQDMHERAEQVSIMQAIYSRAARVMIYTGESNADTSALFRALNNTKDDPSRRGSIVDSALRKTLELFLQRRWFYRIWVIQEVENAKEAVLLCGDDWLPWQRLLETAGQHSSTMVLPSIVGRQDWGRLDVLQALQAARLCEASDPRDKMFAVKGLLNQKISGGITVDYAASPRDIFARFAREQIGERRKLEGIGRGAYMMSTKLEILHYVQDGNMTPSWAPDWSVQSRRSVIGVGTSQYCAGGCCHTGQRPWLDPWSTPLRLRAVKLGAIVDTTRVAGGANDDKSLAEWREFVGAHRSQSYEHDVARSGIDARSNDTLESVGVTPGINGKLIIAGRRLILLDTGEIGLGPAEVQVGDVVCVILGARTPFVLRQIPSNEHGILRASDGPVAHLAAHLVGECYLKCVMFGEALKWHCGDRSEWSGWFEDEAHKLYGCTVSESFGKRGYLIEPVELY